MVVHNVIVTHINIHTHTHTDPQYIHGYEPLPLHEQVDVLYPAVVGVVKTFGQVLLQIGLKVLTGHLTLQDRTHTHTQQDAMGQSET